MKFTKLPISKFDSPSFYGRPSSTYYAMEVKFFGPVETDRPRSNAWLPFTIGGVWWVLNKYEDGTSAFTLASKNRAEIEEINYDLERGDCFDVLPIRPAVSVKPGGDR